MAIFGIGALALAVYLGVLIVTEYSYDKPQGYKDWMQFAALGAGVFCTAILALRSFF